MILIREDKTGFQNKIGFVTTAGWNGEALNETMRCWEFLLPNVVRLPALDVDLMGLWEAYRDRHPGAMFSGCGGGYLIVASEESIPGSFRIKVRAAK